MKNEIRFLVLALMAVLLGSMASATNWSSYHFDIANTGASPDDGPETNSVLWTYADVDAGNIETPLAVHGGKVYGGDDDGWFYCFDAYTGDILWKVELANHEEFYSGSGPSVYNDKVYVCSNNGRMYCFGKDGDGNGGAVWYWTYEMGDPYPSSPVIYLGKIYVGAEITLHCVDAGTGEVVWTYDTGSGDYIRNSPAVYNDKLYISTDKTEVRCLTLEEGAVEWSYSDYGGWSAPALTEIGSGNHYVYVARNAHKVGEAGVMRIDLASNTVEDAYYAAEGRVWATPTLKHGYVWFGSEGGKFYAYAGDEPSPRWTYDVGKKIHCSAAYADSPSQSGSPKIYFTAYDWKLHCLYATRGTADVVWVDDQHSYADQDPVVRNGILYVAGFWNDLNAYDDSASDASVNAYCISTGDQIPVNFTSDFDLALSYTTPYTFTDADMFPPRSFTVTAPDPDPNGHPFDRWSTGATTLAITINSGGAYTAYYRANSGSDSDGDGVDDTNDNCLCIFNSDQKDSDGDGIGDECENFEGDSNNDGCMNIEDVAAVARKWLDVLIPECWESLTHCDGDVDGDGYVGIWDMQVLQKSMYQSYPDFRYNPCADFDHDGTVDLTDEGMQLPIGSSSTSTCVIGSPVWPPI